MFFREGFILTLIENVYLLGNVPWRHLRAGKIGGFTPSRQIDHPRGWQKG